MPMYMIDVRIAATAYVRADNAKEAREQAAFFLANESLEVENSGGSEHISGLPLNDPNLPDVSLSPAMTIVGPVGRAELAEEG